MKELESRALELAIFKKSEAVRLKAKLSRI